MRKKSNRRRTGHSTEEYSKLTSKTTDLAVALDRFRKDSDLAGLNISEIYRDVRDRSPGRGVKL
jgi:hypothetical protein